MLTEAGCTAQHGSQLQSCIYGARSGEVMVELNREHCSDMVPFWSPQVPALQDEEAEKSLEKSKKDGSWLLLANATCHPSLEPTMLRRIRGLDSAVVHPNFRLWMSARPSTLPPSLREHSQILAVETNTVSVCTIFLMHNNSQIV